VCAFNLCGVRVSCGVELFQRANALFVDEDYAGALQAYSHAIDQSPQPRADHFAARAAAHLYMRNQMGTHSSPSLPPTGR